MYIEDNIRKKNVKNIMNKIKLIVDTNKLSLPKDFSNEKVSAMIESGCLKFSIEYTESNNVSFLIETIYNDKVDSIINILNKDIIDAIIKNTIEPKNLALMKEEELNPKKFSEINKKKQKISELKENQGEVNMYTCKKCGGKRTKVKEMQIERGDEPTNFFITCLDCGYVEKQ